MYSRRKWGNEEETVFFTKKDADEIAEIEYEIIHGKRIINLEDLPCRKKLKSDAIELCYRKIFLNIFEPKQIINEIFKFIDVDHFNENCCVPFTRKRTKVYNANYVHLCFTIPNPLFSLLKPKIKMWNKKLEKEVIEKEKTFRDWEEALHHELVQEEYHRNGPEDPPEITEYEFRITEEIDNFIDAFRKNNWGGSADHMASIILNRFIAAGNMTIKIIFLDPSLYGSEEFRALEISAEHIKTDECYQPKKKKRKLNHSE